MAEEKEEVVDKKAEEKQRKKELKYHLKILYLLIRKVTNYT